MAWVTEYDLQWMSPTSPVSSGYIYLQRDEASYIGPLTLEQDSLEIRNIIPNWDDPVARMNCSFTIINDLSDFYELMPLMTASLGQIKVVVTNETATSGTPIHIFEGFLNCETVEQTMLWDSPISLTASGYLSKLQNEYPASVDALEYESLIDVICGCISLTGSTDPINVNISLYENNSAPGAGQTLFNRIDVFQEVWWTNNFERMSALEILTSIMTSFGCYLFWYNNAWYIRHYMDLGTYYPDGVNYVQYDPTLSTGYSYTDTGTPLQDWLVPMDIHSQNVYRQIGGTQTLSVVPALRQLLIRLDQKQYWNLFYPDLSQVASNLSPDPTPVLSSRREWWAYDPGAALYWDHAGQSFRDMANAVYRYGDDLTIVGGIVTAGRTYGLSTRFNLTAQWDTVLNIKFKWGVDQFWNISAFGLRENWQITFTYYLCTYDEVEANRDYFDNSDNSLDEWTLVPDGDPTVNYNTIQITGADLDDTLRTTELSINVPIGEIDGVLDSSGDEGHLDLIFCLGTEIVFEPTFGERAAMACWYGDIVATVSQANRHNLIEGVVDTNFIEKKELTLTLFDAGWSYRNSLFRYVNQYYNTLAEDWTYDGVTIDELEDWIVANKFRFYRIARQEIVMDVYSTIMPTFELLWPFYDSKQADKTFTLLGVTSYPSKNTHHLELCEYDDQEEITLEEQ